ncbi:MAG: hypothetical protein K1X94_30130, partial [Sandaracinaceae bacterium]|nr:hypothetical protein [Sandaracinaceae bacterium]
MTRAARGTIVALGIALAAGPEVTPEHALADLRGPRDVARALEQLENDDDDDARVRAADWLAAHGPDEVVVPALLHALEEEQELGVTVPIALAVAQRARPSDAQGLLELEPTLRSPARAALVVTLAQLGTEESDAWLVRRLASPPGSELRPALEQVAEIARSRREALLSRVLDAIAEAPAPILVQWLASLEDERARATLVTLAISVHAVRATALEGLAHLGPDAETARRLVELGASPEGALRSPELVRALLAADPAAEIGAYLDEETLPALRATALDALVARAPARALEVLGSDPGAMRPTDRHVLEVAIAHPAAPLTPWLAHLVSDASVEPALRDGALEALVTMPGCVVEQAALRDAPLSDEVLALTVARIARRCPERQASVASGDGLEALHLRAIAGKDVREALADAWGGAREER